MIRLVSIAAFALLAFGCGKQPAPAAGSGGATSGGGAAGQGAGVQAGGEQAGGVQAGGGQAAAAKGPKAGQAPGPTNANAPTGKKNPLAGRVFKMPAGKGMTDPMAIKRAMEKGGGLPPGVKEITPESEKKREADDAAKKKAKQVVTDIYSRIAGKPMDVLEVTEVSGLWRITFQTRGVKEAPSTVHVTKDGKLAFEGGFELEKRQQKLQMDDNFATCLKLRGVRIIGDGRTKATRAQLQQVGSFAGKIFVDCGRAKEGCKPLMAKLKLTKLPVIEQGEDRFTGPRPKQFLETLSGCK